MVAFTHDQETTPEADWLASLRITAMAELGIDWTELEKLVVVAAHPDDETLEAAGLLQRADGHGVTTEVLVATLGENSHPHSPTHTPEQLAARRIIELENALETLAPTAHHTVLGLPDGQLREHFAELEHEVILAAGKGGTGTLIVAPCPLTATRTTTQPARRLAGPRQQPGACCWNTPSGGGTGAPLPAATRPGRRCGSWS